MSGSKFPSQGSRIYLDVNVFIYAIEGYAQFESFLVELFDQIDSGFFEAVTSELSVAEALVKPAMDHNAELEKVYLEAIQSTSRLQVIPITRDILISSAQLRGKHPQLRLPDAIHLMTAEATACQSFFTNDKQIKNLVKNMHVLLLSEAIAGKI